MYSKYHSDFVKWFSSHNTGKYQTYDLFRDSMELMSLSLQQVTNRFTGNDDLWEIKEKEYMGIVNRYDKDIVNDMPELLAIITNAFEAGGVSDFLGDVFMNLELSNSYNGQFFTPFSLAKMCGSIVGVDKDEISKKGFTLISDPAIGAGAMPLGVVSSMLDAGMNPQELLFVMGGDIDRRVLNMAFIQLTLLGIPCHLSHQNALSLEMLGDDLVNLFWYTQRCDTRISYDKAINTK